MLFDVHCHLTHEWFKKDQQEVIKRAEKVIIHTAGSGLKDNEEVLKLSENNENIKASLGLYPWDAVTLSEGEIDFNIDFIKKNKEKLTSIGEVGLDHHAGKAIKDWEYQEWVFEKILIMAEEIKKPIVVHTRKAEKETLEILKNHEVKAIIHSYTGPQKLVPMFLEQGYYFSIPAVIVRAGNFQSLVKKVPINRLLTETDAPFMAPVTGERSEPINIKQGLSKIAEIKKLSIKEAEEELTKNYKELFK